MGPRHPRGLANAPAAPGHGPVFPTAASGQTTRAEVGTQREQRQPPGTTWFTSQLCSGTFGNWSKRVA